jgi:AraC-like DNA-binding protein
VREQRHLQERHPGLSVRLMHHVLEEHGRGGDDMLRSAGLGPEVVEDPLTEITRAQELAAVAHFQRVTSDLEGIALRTGRRYRVVTYGAFGLGMLTARNLRQALRIGITYQRLSYSLMTFSIELVGDETVRVVMDDTRLPPELRAFLVERDLAAVVSLCDDLWGAPFHFDTVEVAIAAPAHARAFEEVLGVPVTFGASRHALTFPARLLERPLPQGTPAMEELYERQCRALVERVAGDDDLVERVLQHLVRATWTAMPSLDEVAGELAMSPRTLRRQLAAAGTSFGTLVAQVRRQLATELLLETSLTVEQIALELGYAETSSFSRAFTRWTGQPPSRYRSRTGGGPDTR